MLIPIGIMTGVLSNLSVAVCGGTPGRLRCNRLTAPLSPLCISHLLTYKLLTLTARCDLCALALAETNSLYWPWYCEATGFWVELVKALLQGMLPAIISTFFDTFLLPLAFYFIAQVGLGGRCFAREVPFSEKAAPSPTLPLLHVCSLSESPCR